MTTEKKAREFWINDDKGIFEPWENHWPEPTAEDEFHVIEKSAFDEIAAENEKLKEEVKKLKNPNPTKLSNGVELGSWGNAAGDSLPKLNMNAEELAKYWEKEALDLSFVVDEAITRLKGGGE